MPKFVDYQNEQKVEMDISPGMYARFMNDKERQEMRKVLNKGKRLSLMQLEHEDALDKLSRNYLSLSVKELEEIKKLASRFI